MKTYENEAFKVTVITNEINCEEESYLIETKEAIAS